MIRWFDSKKDRYLSFVHCNRTWYKVDMPDYWVNTINAVRSKAYKPSEHVSRFEFPLILIIEPNSRFISTLLMCSREINHIVVVRRILNGIYECLHLNFTYFDFFFGFFTSLLSHSRILQKNWRVYALPQWSQLYWMIRYRLWTIDIYAIVSVAFIYYFNYAVCKLKICFDSKQSIFSPLN